MRVPSPAAITTAASGFVVELMRMAGAPGFEPGVAGPKPAALPLGYAPASVGPFRGPVDEEEVQRDHREHAGGDEGEHLDPVPEEHDDHCERLRRRQHP